MCLPYARPASGQTRRPVSNHDTSLSSGPLIATYSHLAKFTSCLMEGKDNFLENFRPQRAIENNDFIHGG